MPVGRNHVRRRMIGGRIDSARRRARCAPLVLDSLEERCLLSGAARFGDVFSDAWRSAPPPPPILVARPVADTPTRGWPSAIPKTPIPESAAQRGKPLAAPETTSWVVHSISYESGNTAPLVQAPPTAFEVLRPHDTMSSAQVIASGDSVRLAGVMRPGDSPDLYVVPGDAVAYQVKLVTVESTGEMAPEIFLLDERGAVVGKWTMPADAYQMTINLLDADANSGHEFYLGIAPGGGDSLDHPQDESAFNSYNLLIEPLAPSPTPPTPVGDTSGEGPGGPLDPASPMPNPNDATGLGTGGPTIVFGGVPSFLEQPRAENTNAAMITGTETSLAIASTSALAAGPLPSRLAAPFSGNLGDGESAPEAARGPMRATLLGLFDDAAIEGPLASEVPRPASTENFVAVQGPGGVPLLTAAKTQASEALTEHEGCEPPAWATALAVLTESPVNADPDAVAPASTLADNRKPDHAAERRATRPAVFSIGLSVFATLAATLVLPDFAPTIRGRSGSRRVARRPRWLSNWKRDP